MTDPLLARTAPLPRRSRPGQELLARLHLSARAQRRLALALVAIVLALAALVASMIDGRDRQLALLDRQVAALRQGLPAPGDLETLRVEFQSLQAGQALRLHGVTALGVLGTMLAATLVVSLLARPPRRPASPMAQAIAQLEQSVDQACRLAAALRPVTSHLKSEFRSPSERR